MVLKRKRIKKNNNEIKRKDIFLNKKVMSTLASVDGILGCEHFLFGGNVYYAVQGGSNF